MCGLVGIAGDLLAADEKLFARLLLMDVWRGPDSTGAAVRRTTGDVLLAKVPSHPLDLFDDKRWKTAVEGKAHYSDIFLGHNRLATTGKVSYSNAHPYEYGTIVGAHNGTLDSRSFKALTTEVGDFEVDSQALFAYIDAFGIENTIPEIEGAWALTWIDSKDKTLNFLRNEERPLWLARSEDGKRLLWSSEMGILAGAIKSCDYKVRSDDKGFAFYTLPIDTWFSLSLEDLKHSPGIFPQWKSKTLKGKPKTYTQTSVGKGIPWHQGGNKEWKSQKPSKTTSWTNSMAPTYPYFSVKELKDSYSCCSWCGSEIDHTTEKFKMIDMRVGARKWSTTNILCQECIRPDATPHQRSIEIITDDVSLFSIETDETYVLGYNS